MIFNITSSVFTDDVTSSATTTTISNYFQGTNSAITTTNTYWWEQQHRQTIQRQLAANERSGWVNVGDDGASTVYVQWTSMYGHHLAETTERERARAALTRHDNQHRQKIEIQAMQRAEELLISHLTPQQRADYMRSKWFVVDSKTGRRYKLHRDRAHNIDLIRPDGGVECKLCTLLHGVPPADVLLSQKLHIELAEDEFLRVANRHAA